MDGCVLKHSWRTAVFRLGRSTTIQPEVEYLRILTNRRTGYAEYLSYPASPTTYKLVQGAVASPWPRPVVWSRSTVRVAATTMPFSLTNDKHCECDMWVSKSCLMLQNSGHVPWPKRKQLSLLLFCTDLRELWDDNLLHTLYFYCTKKNFRGRFCRHTQV